MKVWNVAAVAVVGSLLGFAMGCTPGADSFVGAGTTAAGTTGAMTTGALRAGVTGGPFVPVQRPAVPSWKRTATAVELLGRLQTIEDQLRRQAEAEDAPSSEEMLRERYTAANTLLDSAIKSDCQRDLLESLLAAIGSAEEEQPGADGAPANLRQELMFVLSLYVMRENLAAQSHVLDVYRPCFTGEGRLTFDRWPELVGVAVAALDSYEDERARDNLAQLACTFPRHGDQPLRTASWAMLFLRCHELGESSTDLEFAWRGAEIDPGEVAGINDSLPADRLENLGTNADQLARLLDVANAIEDMPPLSQRRCRLLCRSLWRRAALTPRDVTNDTLAEQCADELRQHQVASDQRFVTLLEKAAPGSLESQVAAILLTADGS